MKNANPVWRILAVAAGGWLALALAGCGAAEPEPPPVPKTVNDWFPITVGDVTIDMQLAVTSAEMQRGLMGRTDLGPQEGMLFVYRGRTQMSFWMRNTPTPLDIAFFTSDGVLREIYKLHPHDERPVRSRRDDLQYALEVVQGGFARLGIKPGDQLDLAAVAQGLQDRGFNPGSFAGMVDPRRQ